MSARKTKPCYTLSDTTVSWCSGLLYARICEALRTRRFLSGADRKAGNNFIRELIAAHRQLRGYELSKIIQLSQRRSVRMLTKGCKTKRERRRLLKLLRP